MNERQLARFEGKIVVIAGVGGAIGGALVSRFLEEGAIVVGIDRLEIECAASAVLTADLREDEQVRKAIAEVVRDFGRIDVLYNNSGPLDPDDHDLEHNTVQTWTDAFRNLVIPVVLSCQHVVPVMRLNETGGSIINTGSFLAGMGAATAQTAFSAAKAAVIQTSRDLGIHLSKSGIRVNSLSIGPVESPQSKAMFEKVGAQGLKMRLGHVPTGRFATPAEIAGAAAFLASADAGYITATDFLVDGGIRGAYTIPD